MKPTAKILLLLGFCILLNTSCNMGAIVNQITESNDPGDAILLTKKSFPVASINELKVTTSGGSISVTGDADQEAVLEMYVRANNGRSLSREEIQDILDRDYEIDIQQRNGVLHAHAKRNGNLNWNNTLSISFEIRTGNRIATDLSTSGGNIQLANLFGKQRFKTSGGGLKIENLKGDIDGRTSGGGIQAYNSQGMINLSTSGGSIQLADLKGEISASTSGGNIEGQQVTGTLNAKTSGGNVNLNDSACKISASSSGGNVTVGVTELAGDVQLSTSGGSINLTLPRNASVDVNLKGSKVNTTDLSNFNGSNNKGRMVGSINGGGMSIDASTSGGNVNLNFK